MKGAVVQAKPWGEKHVIEATAVLWRMAADIVCDKGFLGKGRGAGARDAIPHWAATEAGFIECAAFYIGAPAAGRLADRVRDRAEGREVVEVEVEVEEFYRVKLPDGRYTPKAAFTPASSRRDAERFRHRGDAANEAKCWTGARVVPVTLTRRRIVRTKDVS